LLPWPQSNKMSQRRQRSGFAHLPMQASTRTVGRSFGRKVTLRWSIKLITPPGLSA
jgi:hypothetical protein